MFSHGCPYARVTLPWMAIYMASLAFSWVRNLGSKYEGKTLRPDHAGAQQPLKQKSQSAASNSVKEGSKEGRGMEGIHYVVNRAKE